MRLGLWISKISHIQLTCTGLRPTEKDVCESSSYLNYSLFQCPRCHIRIEKNGGCNHMQCFNCKHDFCWMCLEDWKSHGSEYYACSRYKENPNIANESIQAQAREALKKYLHYYERVSYTVLN